MKSKQNKESRLDRIEKGLALLLQGASELKESQKKTDAQLQETNAQQRKTDAQIQKTEKQLEKTIIKLDEIGRQLGDLGLVQGEVAKDLFYRNVRYLFKNERDMIFADVKRNLKRKGAGEYDIVAVNGDSVLVIEVKNKLQKRMVDNFLEKRLPNPDKPEPKRCKTI
jgi:septal ring factor EnvC (AmiA/AmiB activator)